MSSLPESNQRHIDISELTLYSLPLYQTELREDACAAGKPSLYAEIAVLYYVNSLLDFHFFFSFE